MISEIRGSVFRHFLSAAAISLIVISVFYMVWLRSSIKSLEYKLGVLQHRKAVLVKEQRNLIAARDNLLSIASIDNVAIKKMGFNFPDRNKVFYVKERI
ncbi:hypothetical protein [Candidatus Magnetomonas plexicatena]|uniref:hypothetical protein n=1 Tax=Candidatus Magnetomonas plexicatena TaxID=2552947 RepID=UPI001C752B2A|nr:hypothetical protein E2O03_004695 [Nitrospirales bacterium LBB_01]